MDKIGNNKIDIKILYEINNTVWKTTEIVVDTATGNTKSIKITEVVKHDSIFGSKMYCATTAKVNYVGKKGWL